MYYASEHRNNGKRYCERYEILTHDKNSGLVSDEKAKQKLEELLKKSNLELTYKQLADDKSIKWFLPELPEIQKAEEEEEEKKKREKLQEKMKPFKKWKKLQEKLNPSKTALDKATDRYKKLGLGKLGRTTDLGLGSLDKATDRYKDLGFQVDSTPLVKTGISELRQKGERAPKWMRDMATEAHKSLGHIDPNLLAYGEAKLKDPAIQSMLQQLKDPTSELSQKLKAAQAIDPAIHKLAKEQWRERENEKEIMQNYIPRPINKNQALEDKLDSQIRETKLLREELKQTKEKNLVKNIITREPNVIRPSTFTPPNSQNDASEFATECVYWYEEEHNRLPTQKELWRLIKAIATDTDVAIQGFLVEMIDRNTVKIEEKKWTKEQCRKFFNEYLK